MLKETISPHPSSIEEASAVFPRMGTDEVGKGDFFGPLVVAAVYMENERQLSTLTIADSKKLSDSAIRRLAPQLQRTLRYSLVKILPRRYNELFSRMRNINLILGWAHAQVIKNLLEQNCKPQLIVVDRFGPPQRLLRHISHAEVQKKIAFFTQGERDQAVACASMIARLCFMQEMEKLSVQAGFQLPFGAGPQVDEAAQRLAGRIGKSNLNAFAKIHFKNFTRIRSPG